MILPDTYIGALLLAILALVCWGSWANAYKLAGRQRFELFYWDWALGVLVAAILAAFTFGSLGFDFGGGLGGFAFLDDLMRSSKHSWGYGIAAGAVFNLGTILLVASMSLAGMSVAFPVGLGLAVLVAMLLDSIGAPHVNVVLLLSTVVLVLGAALLDVFAYRDVALRRARQAIKTGRTKSTKVTMSWKGVALAAIGGPIVGLCFPLVDRSRAPETGMGPYAAAFMFAAGVMLSTFLYDLLLMNLPVRGEPVEVLQYFRQPNKSHLLALLGGMVWTAGTVSLFVALSATSASATRGTESLPLLGPATAVQVLLGAALLAGLWGLLVWKEFADAPGRTRALVAMALGLLFAGLILILLAPPLSV
jgi:glucose uptake protein